jgi:hypothetical protein
MNTKAANHISDYSKFILHLFHNYFTTSLLRSAKKITMITKNGFAFAMIDLYRAGAMAIIMTNVNESLRKL